MKFVMAPILICPTCHTALEWTWKEGIATIHHCAMRGLEYCPNFGKSFEAPAVELEEKQGALANG